ncbi:hypothetical protein [Rhodospirillum sp. A1_3_36]|uniref:hypothetical protein n=1 Tax=Rhodospirillum sp. A1_3_36 TaxID=3391666 RepID=UPI0039A4DF61
MRAMALAGGLLAAALALGPAQVADAMGSGGVYIPSYPVEGPVTATLANGKTAVIRVGVSQPSQIPLVRRAVTEFLDSCPALSYGIDSVALIDVGLMTLKTRTL